MAELSPRRGSSPGACIQDFNIDNKTGSVSLLIAQLLGLTTEAFTKQELRSFARLPGSLLTFPVKLE